MYSKFWPNQTVSFDSLILEQFDYNNSDNFWNPEVGIYKGKQENPILTPFLLNIPTSVCTERPNFLARA